MDRRWVRLLIIFLVVVAAIAVPSAGGKRIAGAARSAPVPAPPKAGDCLTAPETDTWLQGGPAPYRSAALGPCVGQVYGEVVAVTPDRRQHHPASRSPGYGSVLIDDPNEAPCLQTAARYIGLTVGADDNILIASYWEPLGPLSASPSGPTERQIAAGQNWVACVVFVPDSSGRSVAYRGTLKKMFTLGTEPAAMAVCLDSADLSDAEITPCARPHRV